MSSIQEIAEQCGSDPALFTRIQRDDLSREKEEKKRILLEMIYSGQRRPRRGEPYFNELHNYTNHGRGMLDYDPVFEAKMRAAPHADKWFHSKDVAERLRIRIKVKQQHSKIVSVSEDHRVWLNHKDARRVLTDRAKNKFYSEYLRIHHPHVPITKKALKLAVLACQVRFAREQLERDCAQFCSKEML